MTLQRIALTAMERANEEFHDNLNLGDVNGVLAATQRMREINAWARRRWGVDWWQS